ncbi:Rieske (2Fe-2S) protein [Streptomyces sp. NBC_01803]|uniref:Rieske (2Fe-2S) protein n=1 Tax=Streptomyces sp. NBC_01803 TaxID=2975946 RepID=UPI002DD7FDEE|nr:Rieske (2Fe-2S) protein [Streptomyces sp. NBC_01803]WSA45404.1 Rieske (2Fe-2S) protein [Streptomyces sp. NBC_01803]
MTTTPQHRQALCRRTVLAATAASAGTLALTACGDDGGSEGETAPGSGPIAALVDVPVGEAVAVTTPNGAEALLFRSDETTVAAFSAICTHAGCGVQPDGDRLHCPCHDSVFDAATGERLEGPADAPLPPIRVRIEDDQVIVE